jgi:hypothetical protein
MTGWRLTLGLGFLLFLALWIGGQDRGQMRPGLALAPRASRVPEAPVDESLRRLAAPAPPLPLALPPSPLLTPPEPRPTTLPITPLPRRAPVPHTPGRLASAAPPAPGPGVSAVTALPVPAALPATGLGLSGAAFLYVARGPLNLRQGPGEDYAIVTQLSPGTAVLPLGAPDGLWLRIRVEPSGAEGYVSTAFLSVAP